MIFSYRDIEHFLIYAFILGLLVGVYNGGKEGRKVYQKQNSLPFIENDVEQEKTDDAPENLYQIVSESAEEHGIDTLLIFAIIEQESKWNITISSSKGAIGIMQIMPKTGRGECGLTKKQLLEPKKNINCGAGYFARQLKRFGSVKLALCAYNAGPGAVSKRGNKCPNYKETKNYAKKILTNWRMMRPDGSLTHAI